MRRSRWKEATKRGCARTRNVLKRKQANKMPTGAYRMGDRFGRVSVKDYPAAGMANVLAPNHLRNGDP